MDINRPTTANAGGGFNLNNISTNTMMTILIALVIIILLIMLFQSSSAGGASSAPAAANAFGFTNPLNATMRTNPFVNTPQRTML
jgi:Occlusion-derived virus envelope protein ODV-E18